MYHCNKLVITLLGGLLLTACGGGGSKPQNPAPQQQQPTSDPAPNTGTTGDTKTDPPQQTNTDPTPVPNTTIERPGSYLLIKGSLYAVNSENPAQLVKITDERISQEELYLTYSYNAASQTATRLSGNLALFVQNDKLWKLDVTRGSALIPTAVSSAIGLNSMCDRFPFNSLDPASMLYGFSLPGTDKRCNTADDHNFIVNAAMDARQAPIEITGKVNSLFSYRPLWNVNDPLNKLIGILATNGKELIRYDANFANPTVVTTGHSNVSVNFRQSQYANGAFLRIDKAIGWYDTVKNLLTFPILNLQDGDNLIGRWACDNQRCYFLLKNNTKYTVYSVPANGSGPATPLTSELPGINDASILTLTSNSIIYTGTRKEGTQTLKTINLIQKTGGAAKEIETSYSYLPPLEAFNFFYYTRNTPSGPVKDTAIVRDTNGNIVAEYPRSRWVGESSVTTSQKAPGYDRVILARNYDDTKNNLTGAVLQLFDAQTNTLLRDLGPVPADVSNLIFLGYGDTLLGTGYTISNNNQDIFFIDLEKANSLKKITNTPTINENAVF